MCFPLFTCGALFVHCLFMIRPQIVHYVSVVVRFCSLSFTIFHHRSLLFTCSSLLFTIVHSCSPMFPLRSLFVHVLFTVVHFLLTVSSLLFACPSICRLKSRFGVGALRQCVAEHLEQHPKSRPLEKGTTTSGQLLSGRAAGVAKNARNTRMCWPNEKT